MHNMFPFLPVPLLRSEVEKSRNLLERMVDVGRLSGLKWGKTHFNVP